MNRYRFGLLVGVLILLIIGGGLSTQLSGGVSDLSDLLPFLQTTSNPEASAMEAEPWQAEQFFLLIVFILFNMVGIGATIAVIMWFLHRGVSEARAEPEEESAKRGRARRSG